MFIVEIFVIKGNKTYYIKEYYKRKRKKVPPDKGL